MADKKAYGSDARRSEPLPPNADADAREARQTRGPRTTVYEDRAELLAAALELAKTTIAKARGSPPDEREIARLRDYPMSPANFERTERTEKAAKAALRDIKRGYALLRSGLEAALALDPWDPSEQGTMMVEGGIEQVLISTRPAKTIRPGGYAAALTFYRGILEKTLGGLDLIWNMLQGVSYRETNPDVSPAAIRPIDHRDLILYDFDRPLHGQRFKPPELAAWSLLARGRLPDMLDIRGGCTAAEVLKTERLAIRKRAKRRGPDPIHGSAWGGFGEIAPGGFELHAATTKAEQDFAVASRNAYKTKIAKEKGVARRRSQ